MTVRTVAALIALVSATAVPAAAQASATLPPGIAAAFRRAYPNARILHVSREPRDGKIVYEVESQDGPTRRDLLYGLDAQVIEIEEMIPMDSVPAAVRAAVRRDAPGATTLRAERVTLAAVITYEVLVRANGVTRSLAYDAEGNRRP